MESVVRNVGELESQDRAALEHLLGRRLREGQQLVIQVVNLDAVVDGPDRPTENDSALPDWCKVYDGLSDGEITELEKTILTRADLSRSVE